MKKFLSDRKDFSAININNWTLFLFLCHVVNVSFNFFTCLFRICKAKRRYHYNVLLRKRDYTEKITCKAARACQSKNSLKCNVIPLVGSNFLNPFCS